MLFIKNSLKNNNISLKWIGTYKKIWISTHLKLSNKYIKVVAWNETIYFRTLISPSCSHDWPSGVKTVYSKILIIQIKNKVVKIKLILYTILGRYTYLGLDFRNWKLILHNCCWMISIEDAFHRIERRIIF